MKPFAAALLIASAFDPVVGQDVTTDLDLACLMANPVPDYCADLEAIRADVQTKLETIETG